MTNLITVSKESAIYVQLTVSQNCIFKTLKCEIICLNTRNILTNVGIENISLNYQS